MLWWQNFYEIARVANENGRGVSGKRPAAGDAKPGKPAQTEIKLDKYKRDDTGRLFYIYPDFARISVMSGNSAGLMQRLIVRRPKPLNLRKACCLW